eukprot:gene17265-biopygen11373
MSRSSVMVESQGRVSRLSFKSCGGMRGGGHFGFLRSLQAHRKGREATQPRSVARSQPADTRLDRVLPVKPSTARLAMEAWRHGGIHAHVDARMRIYDQLQGYLSVFGALWVR